jgi:hypothetical protein
MSIHHLATYQLKPLPERVRDKTDLIFHFLPPSGGRKTVIVISLGMIEIKKRVELKCEHAFLKVLQLNAVKNDLLWFICAFVEC